MNSPTALAWVARSYAALAQGAVPKAIQLQGRATWTAGSDHEYGTATLSAKPGGFSRVELNLDEGTRIAVRSRTSGVPMAAWRETGMPRADGAVHTRALASNWTPAAWFAPVYWLAAALNADAVGGMAPWRVEDLGRETIDLGSSSVSVEHLRYYRWLAQQAGAIRTEVAEDSRCDVYLGSTSALPVEIRYRL